MSCDLWSLINSSRNTPPLSTLSPNTTFYSNSSGDLRRSCEPGFHDVGLCTYRRCGPGLLTVGCENLTIKFYCKYLDYRSGRGVFRPGINFYSEAEATSYQARNCLLRGHRNLTTVRVRTRLIQIVFQLSLNCRANKVFHGFCRYMQMVRW
jgi:hypothetical protein